MAAASTKVLDEALKLPVEERVRVAERLLESADAEGYDEETHHASWANEVQRRSAELKDGSVRGLSVDEARKMIAADPADDER